MLYETIAPGQFWAHRFRPYAIWVHRLCRAVARELEPLPKNPRLPWPTVPRPYPSTVQVLNLSLYPAVRRGLPRRTCRTTHLPHDFDCDQARIEVYEPQVGDDHLWRIRLCFATPKPWEIEAWVDPGDAVHLPFFREVRVRFSLKARVGQALRARAGRWEGEGRHAEKLNALPGVLEQLESTVAEAAGIGCQVPGAGGKRLAERTTPAASGPPLLRQKGEPFPPTAGPEAGGFSTGCRLPTAGYRISTAGVRLPSTVYRSRATDYRPSVDEGGITLGLPAQLNFYYRVPEYLDGEGTRDGFLATRAEAGPDSDEWNWPVRRGRKPGRRRSAVERLVAVVPAAWVDPSGARQSVLTVVLRPRTQTLGLAAALGLARLTEAGIKYRRPPIAGRRRSWRQQLRDALMFRPGLLTQLVHAQQAFGAGDRGPDPDLAEPTVELWMTVGGFRVRIPLHLIPKERHVPNLKTRFSERIRPRGRPRKPREVKKFILPGPAGTVGRRPVIKSNYAA